MKSLFKSLVVYIITFEAKLLLRRTKPTIIAVTGNVGKTSTKDAIYEVLKDHKSVRKSEKSYNSEIGVPLSILGLSNGWSNPFLWIKNIFDGFLVALFQHEYPEILVLEMGVDRPGDMKELVKWIHPDIVVFTRLPDIPVHVEYFDSPEAVIQEKMYLVHALKPDGVFVYNNDDEKLVELLPSVRQHAIGYGRYAPTHVTASADEVVYKKGIPTGLRFVLTHFDEEATVTLVGALGVHHAYSSAAAVAVASVLDISLDAATTSLVTYVPPPGRVRIIEGLKNTIIIDDTYNSSPVAAERALLTLGEIHTTGRKIAVLGDMLELGSFSVREHERVGELAAETVDMLVTVGVRSRKVADGALAFGLSEKNILQYDEAIRAGRELQNLIQEGDVILIKGSQSLRCERIVEDIMAHPEKAETLLVRQSPMWKAR